MSTDRVGGEGASPGRTEAGAGGPADEPNLHRIRYQEFFEFAPDGQVVTDPRGVILEANHAAAALFRCAKAFLIDKPLGLFVLPGHRHRFYESLMRLRLPYGADEFDTWFVHRDQRRDVTVRAAVLEQGHGGPGLIRWLLRDMTEQRRAEAARVELQGRLVTAQEDERRRIARELHDEMGQLLTALILDLKLIGDTLPAGSPAREQLDRVRRAAGEIGQAMHRIAVDLRPTALDDLGLDVTLRNHVAEWSRRTGIRADFREVGPAAGRVPADIETALFRILQETLTNVLKHARATLVSVILERRQRSLRLIVEDNGRGFDADAALQASRAGGRLGLLGIRERVTLCGGSLIIESGPGGPTSIFAEVPVAGAHVHDADG